MPKIIEAEQLSHTYLPGSVYEHQALKDINFSLDRGKVLGIFGPNGSGKSTLAQHFNGLLRPTGGSMLVCGLNTADPKISKDLWKKAGLVFQYPEQQIFQISVYDEIAYGPRNLGLPEREIKARVAEALQQVGLTREKTAPLTPASLSGGLRRKVAIAGMLAIRPELLILDEPMASLDLAGRRFILDIIKKRRQKNETTIIISHSLKEIMTITDKIAILDKGFLAFFGDVKDLLTRTEILARYHFELPEFLQVLLALSARGFDLKTNVRSMQEASKEILSLLKKTKARPIFGSGKDDA
ncbi:energy-coupling factor transport system ATP-binding protein [Desulfotomaculum arcticum]|uniref:Energy-coupling factor transport system ATP-binding protein n=1 Tax=Desulfotruncus arcticus DSM 17038 TaxID=1121424 RepID=A0A1I2R1V0_9FIRM|nr:ATP-binding cassette domain-containing protein [Desulfotruncus arcticus]SFG34755.1 energy-coupling factor transport system ATP-binding protein [Desulfotomaculum arcticum] [Desulfotruncus arcticus DSM 17038]